MCSSKCAFILSHVHSYIIFDLIYSVYLENKDSSYKQEKLFCRQRNFLRLYGPSLAEALGGASSITAQYSLLPNALKFLRFQFIKALTGKRI